MHVLGLRTGQVIDLADVRLRIGEQRVQRLSLRPAKSCPRRTVA